MARNSLPLGALDQGAVTAALLSTASRDPDELDLLRARFGAWVRVPRRLGTALVLGGVLVGLAWARLWLVPVPALIGVWLWRRATLNRAALERAIADYTAEPAPGSVGRRSA